MSKQLIESHLVRNLTLRKRLSDFNTENFLTIASKSALKKAIKKDLVFLNGELGKSYDFVDNGDVIKLYKDDSFFNKPMIDLNLEVLYEDDYLAIIYKPAGIVVSGNRHWTIQNALGNNIVISSQKDALKRPEPIHRLDYPTSGALLIGKTSEMVIKLNQMFEEKIIQKTYHAVVMGNIKSSGIINIDVDGKPSETIYKVLKKVSSPKFAYLNLVELKPHTGRKHQLRKHLSEIGYPILGDLEYGKKGFILKGKGLYLHASRLNFIHPITSETIEIRVELPKKFKKLFPDVDDQQMSRTQEQK